MDMSKQIQFQEILSSLSEANIQQHSTVLCSLLTKEDEDSFEVFDRFFFKILPTRLQKFPLYATLLSNIKKTGFDTVFTEDFKSFLMEPNQPEIASFLSNLIEVHFYTANEAIDMVLSCFEHSETLDNLSIIQLLYCTFFCGKLFKSSNAEKYQQIIQEFKIRSENIEVDLHLDDNSEVFSFLYKSFCEADSVNFALTNEFPNFQLVSALQRDDDESLRSLLSSDLDANDVLEPTLLIPTSSLSFGPPIICCAAFYGAFKCLKLLLDSGASTTATDDEERTLATFASMNHLENAIQILDFLKSRHLTFSNQKAMSSAISFFNQRSFNWLLNELKVPEDSDCVHAAAQSNNIIILQDLIKLGCNLEQRDEYNWTPLHLACAHNSIESLQILLSLPNIDVNTEDFDRETPLHIGCKEGYLRVVKLLLESSKININARDKMYATPLHWAALYKRDKVVKVLLKCPKIELNPRDLLSRTPVHCAASCNAVAVLQHLATKNEADFSIPDAEGNTPLLLAAKGNHWETMSFLITFPERININHKNEDKQSALSIVASKGVAELFQKMVQINGIDLTDVRAAYEKLPPEIKAILDALK